MESIVETLQARKEDIAKQWHTALIPFIPLRLDTQEVKAFTLQQGAHLVGIAPVSRFEGAPLGHHPVDLLPGARSVVVFAVRAPRGLLACEAKRPAPSLIPEEERWAKGCNWPAFRANARQTRASTGGGPTSASAGASARLAR